jgi:OOP family OmpA-OmpF porin
MSSKLFYGQLFGVLLIVLLMLFAVPKYLKTIPETLRERVNKQLSDKQLKWASVRVNGRDITLSGVSPTMDEHREALLLSESVFGVRSVVDHISPQIITPYTMNLTVNKSKVKAEGYLPSKEDKVSLFALIEKHYPQRELIDKIDIGAGEPKSWSTLIETIMFGIKDLDASSVHIVDDEVQISGKIEKLKAREEFEATLKDFKGNPYKISTHIVAMDRPLLVCQEKFNSVLSKQKIKFASNKSSIASGSEKLLKELAYISSLCPQAKMVIVGHTDSFGDDEKNKKLSLERAKSVVAKLFQEGVALNRMDTIGAGETEPIADNKREEGRAKNRRIEFKVIMNKER